MVVAIESPNYEDLFSEQFAEFSKKVYKVPIWQLNACKETYDNITHYCKHLDLHCTAGCLTLIMEIYKLDFKLEFMFDKESLVVRINGIRKLHYGKDRNLSEIMIYVIEKIYEAGKLTPSDMIILNNIAMDKTVPCNDSKFQEAADTLKQIKKDKRKGLYPNLDKNTIEIVSTLMTIVPANGLCKAKIELMDNGHSLAFVYERNKKKIIAKVKYTAAIDKHFYVVYQDFDNDVLVENKVIVDDMEKMATWLNGKLLHLSRIKK